jgi:hypothetical protein
MSEYQYHAYAEAMASNDPLAAELNARLADLGLAPDLVPPPAQSVVESLSMILGALVPSIADSATSLRIVAAVLNTYAMTVEDRARELEADQRRREASCERKGQEIARHARPH